MSLNPEALLSVSCHSKCQSALYHLWRCLVTVSVNPEALLSVSCHSECQLGLYHLWRCLVTVCLCLVTVSVSQYYTTCVGVLSQSVWLLSQWQSTLNHFCVLSQWVSVNPSICVLSVTVSVSQLFISVSCHNECQSALNHLCLCLVSHSECQ